METNNRQKVIVRGDRSGVFFGELAGRNGQEVELANCRRLWYWSGAASLHQLAAEGVKRPQKCKFTMPIASITILDAIEIIPCADAAIDNIDKVGLWKIQ